MLYIFKNSPLLRLCTSHTLTWLMCLDIVNKHRRHPELFVFMLHVAVVVKFLHELLLYILAVVSRRKMGNCKYSSIFLSVAIFLIGVLAIFLQFHRELGEL